MGNKEIEQSDQLTINELNERQLRITLLQLPGADDLYIPHY
jgi:hypothetical protein